MPCYMQNNAAQLSSQGGNTRTNTVNLRQGQEPSVMLRALLQRGVCLLASVCSSWASAPSVDREGGRTPGSPGDKPYGNLHGQDHKRLVVRNAVLQFTLNIHYVCCLVYAVGSSTPCWMDISLWVRSISQTMSNTTKIKEKNMFITLEKWVF